jgi:hypothetical protein
VDVEVREVSNGGKETCRNPSFLDETTLKNRLEASTDGDADEDAEDAAQYGEEYAVSNARSM